MRRSLTTLDPSDFVAHDHVVWCGEGLRPLANLAASAFAQALERRERLVLIADAPDEVSLSGLGDVESLLADGVLELATIGKSYTEFGAAEDLRASFVARVEDALAQGFTGVCVVADNSAAASGSEANFAAWLSWEAVADRLQASLPINGVCYFDTTRVPEQRLADLAALHPVASEEIEAPPFRLTFDDDVLRVSGEIDAFASDRLRRLLAAAPELTRGVVDITDAEFIDHRTLLALNDVGQLSGSNVQVRGVRDVIQRVWDVLDVPQPALEFC